VATRSLRSLFHWYISNCLVPKPLSQESLLKPDFMALQTQLLQVVPTRIYVFFCLNHCLNTASYNPWMKRARINKSIMSPPPSHFSFVLARPFICLRASRCKSQTILTPNWLIAGAAAEVRPSFLGGGVSNIGTKWRSSIGSPWGSDACHAPEVANTSSDFLGRSQWRLEHTPLFRASGAVHYSSGWWPALCSLRLLRSGSALRSFVI